MVEGRCQLSSYVTGASPNRHGVCSPASFVRWDERDDGSRSVRLNNVLIDEFQPEEPAGYPTVCKGRFEVGNEVFHALEEPTSLNTMELLPRLKQAGVAAVKIEGRQRGQAYVRSVTRSEEHTSELQSLMRTSYAVFCLNKKKTKYTTSTTENIHNHVI